MVPPGLQISTFRDFSTIRALIGVFFGLLTPGLLNISGRGQHFGTDCFSLTRLHERLPSPNVHASESHATDFYVNCMWMLVYYLTIIINDIVYYFLDQFYYTGEQHLVQQNILLRS
jgi:hypothetical protein